MNKICEMLSLNTSLSWAGGKDAATYYRKGSFASSLSGVMWPFRGKMKQEKMCVCVCVCVCMGYHVCGGKVS